LLFRKRLSFAENDFEQVVEACRANNAQAQRVLFKQFYGYAKSVSLRYTATIDEAEDVLNESFLKVFQHLHQYDTALPFKAWLRTIVINTAISYYRKYHKLDTSAGLEQGQDVAFDDNVVDQISAEEILALVQQLPTTQRAVFSMHVVDGYSLREVADLLHCNEATVRSHFLRARQRLQTAIKALYPHRFAPNPYNRYEN
jgi:RNA polymerase sigma-70 factor (ECF subfamily)